MGADVIGVNCSVGPAGVLEAVEKLATVIDAADLRAAERRPAARRGRPEDLHGVPGVHGRVRQAASSRRVPASSAAAAAPRPSTSRRSRRSSQSVVAARTSRSSVPRLSRTGRASSRVPLAERSRFGGKLAAGRVRHHGRDRAAQGRRSRRRCSSSAAQLKAAGVDAVNVPDGPRAQSRMGARSPGVMIEREVGIEAVVHYCLPRPQSARHAVRPARRGAPRDCATC